MMQLMHNLNVLWILNRAKYKAAMGHDDWSIEEQEEGELL